ncbi:RHS repeat-associated core domain-containing protein [Corallococcus exiguus]|uniref:RHS repeat-associated core domain-containing protein n=1 Tax=Corallococcus exiguus TaxID=83462 RepID=UPI0039F038FB
MTITDPATSPATVNESPYVVKGTVGDTHLAGVTVKGQPATVLGGAFSVPVALAQGQTVVEVVAVDQAGNTERKNLTLIVDHAPPLVTVLSPVSGSESPQAVVHVRAKVEAFAALSEVRIGTGLAAEESTGVYGADLPLSLGENTLKVQATDVNGLIGRASVVVRYRNPATEPLVVTGVQPSAGASDVKTDALISVSFNKAATLASVRQGFKVKAQGKNLEGGYSLAPGGQTATFIANAPLPEGELLQVEVKGIQAEVGPEQGAAFYSQLTVRRPLTRVRGSVMDDAFEPLSGVRVILEGTSETTRTSADGNWSFITSASGPRVVRYEGGTTAEGRPLPTVRRMLTITPEVETVDAPLALTAVDTASATRVDTTQALHVDFAQKHGALAIDGDPGSLLFEDGKTEGQLTATRLQPVSLPVRLENNATPTAVWQVGPAGVRVQKPILLQFPNVTGLPVGRYVLVLAHEPRTHVLARAGLAVVKDSATIQTEEPLSLRSVELVGYMALTEQQDTIVREALARSGGQGSATPDAGMEGSLPPGMLQTPEAPWWKRALNQVVGEAHAQLAYAFLPVLDEYLQQLIPGLISGKVRAPQDQQLTVQLSDELTGFISIPRQVTFPYAMPVSLRASRISDGSGAERVDAFISAKTEGGVDIAPPAGETWSVSDQRSDSQELTLAGNVELVRGGVTVITLGARMGTELRTVTLTVQAVPVADAGAQTFQLIVARDDQATSNGQELQSVVRFPDVRVTVTGPGPAMSGVTGKTGEYGIPVMVPGGSAMGIACADIPLGPRPLLGHDPETGAAVVQSMVSASYPACSPTFTANIGQLTRADILVDARLLHGALYFVDREGRSLRHDCGEGATSEYDAQKGGFASIADVDIPRTEVHFFRADDLERPIAQFTVGVPDTECEAQQPGKRVAQGRYARVRMGPTTPFKRVIRERCRELNPAIDQDQSAPTPTTLNDEDRAFYETECRDNRTNFLRLTAGEPLVVVAVNHATGHTGMTRIQVPAISKLQLDANGRCSLDDQLGGPLKVKDFGQDALVSRCSVASLGIAAPVYLYPPEIDVRVWRSAEADGIRQDAPPTLVRTGGAATTRDTYVHLDTHWRVRTLAPAEWRLPNGGVRESPVDLGLPADRVDGGISECRVPGADGGTEPCRPDYLRDEGVSGRLLETCSAYGPGMASQLTKAVACFREGDLEDVPAGVPPLAGRVVRVTGSAVEEPAVAQFGVVPGRGSAALQAAMRIVTPSGQRVTLGSLPKANYYLHVVGHEVFPRDQDGDGVLRPQERNAPPPDFSEATEAHPAGLPKRALGVKNVYSSLDPDGFKVLRYDPAREHEFRVMELTQPEVVAQGSLDSRVLDGESAEADSDDLAYQFFAGLMQPAPGRANTPTGDYVVRFGSDEFGVECEVNVTFNSITGNCDNEFIDDVLSANDLLYVELYLSGNADNVLYRFNLMGMAPRVDLLKAGSAFTARRSVETGTGGRSVTDRSISLPASAHFALDPAVIHSGRVKVCTSEDCGTGDLVNQVDVQLQLNGTYAVSPLDGGSAEDPLEQSPLFGLNGARLFQQPIPAHLVSMPGSGVEPKRFFLVQEVSQPEPRRLVRTLGRPRGTFEGLNARAPGQLTVKGINVADGHLSFEHEDFAVPQLAEAVRFARSYNNQSSLVSTTGVGWTNNYDGLVQEERLGRYSVVIAGQAYDFPVCANVVRETRMAQGCVTDRSHGMQLDMKEKAGQTVVVVTTAEGFVYEFGTRAKGFSLEERRRWMLDRVHDGHGRGDEDEGWTRLTYEPGSNLVSMVERTPGRLQLAMTYEAINTGDDTVAYRLRNMARNQGFALLKTVEVRLKAGEQVLHHLELTHDKRGNLLSVSRTSALPATQVWEYDYAPLPTGLSGHALWSASNEVTSARLKQSPPEGGTPVIQWQSAYGREAQHAVYAHVDEREVVTSVVGTGMPSPGWRIVAANESTRTIKRPDGVDVSLNLNDYGNTKATQVPGLAPSSVAWGSEARGGPVQMNSSMTPMGREVSNTINDRLQLDGVTLRDAPTSIANVPGASGRPLWSVTSRQSETGRVTGVSVSTGNGPVSVSRPLSASGDSEGVTVTNADADIVFTAQQFPDPDGVVQGGQDASGNTLTFSGHETQPLGLPRFVDVTRTLQSTGGRASYQVEYDYDALGNRTLEWNHTTGARVELTYDSVGRLQSRTVAGNPAQVWTYSYVLTNDGMKVTKTLALGRWGRSQSNTTEYQQGLKRAERFTYGLNAQVGAVVYDDYQGTRLQSFQDARGYRHTLTYDSAGRLTGETVGGKSLYTNVPDDDGNLIEVTNSDGLKTRIGYDALGRPVSWAYETKGSGEPCNEQCRFSDVETVVLDAEGSVVKRTFGTLAKKHVLESGTDAMGREVSVQSNAQSHGGVHAETAYDAAGRVVHRTDFETGLDETYAYDDVLGRLTRYVRTVQSAEGVRTLTETRAYTDNPAGTSLVLVTHTLSGEAATETPTRQELRTYSVDAQGRILSITETVDGQPAVHVREYDALGRLYASVDPLGRRMTREYDAAGNLVSETQPGNITTTFTHDAEGNVQTQTGPLENESWGMTYDALGRMQTRTLNGQPPQSPWTWTYAYPGDGLETETDPEGTVVARTRNARGLVEHEVWTGVTSGERSVRTRYDGPWMKWRTTIEGDSAHVIKRDSVTAIDDRGRTRLETESWSSPGYSYAYTTTTGWADRTVTSAETWTMNDLALGVRTVTAQVDSLGNVVRRVQSGAEDQWEYYADGKPMRSRAYGFAPDELTQWTYDTSGRVKTQRFGSEETAFTYYADGQLHSETTPDLRVKTLTYNDRGLPETESLGRGTDVSRTRYVAYDNAGHATVIRQADGTPDAVDWQYLYGSRDELLEVTPPGLGTFKYTYDALARLKTITPPAGSVTPEVTYGYDFMGREVSRKRGTATWITNWANGNPEVQNELNERVARVLDGRGRVVHEEFKAGRPTADASGAMRTFTDLDTVDYVYNGRNQLRKVTERRGANTTVRSLSYDGQDRLETINSGNADTITYHYHNSGVMDWVQSPAGTVNYDVGPLQRLSKVTLAEGTQLDVEWEAGGRRVKAVGNDALQHSYCYDNRGRIASVTHDIATEARNARRENCDSAPSSLINSPHLRYRYTYDNRGNRLSELVERAQAGTPGGAETTEYGYDLADRLMGVRYPEGQSVLYALHNDGSRKAEKRVSGYAGGLSLSESAFNAVSQPQEHVAYGYDALGGLQKTTNGLAAHAVIAAYQTDLAGRLVSEQRGSLNKLFHFDAAERLVKVEQTDGSQQWSATYQYDYAGLRRSRTVNGATTNYLWSGRTLVEEHLPDSTQLLYQFGAGLTLAVGSERILQDGLGSAVARISPGSPATHHRYDAWGNYRDGNRPTSTQASLGYTGHAYDAELGLTYAQQRWLDTSTGRFLSEDPVGPEAYLAASQGQNPWLYAHGNPTRYTDPDGRWVNLAVGVGVGAIGGCAFGYLGDNDGEGLDACLKGAAVGAATGLVAGATLGASMWATGAMGIGTTATGATGSVLVSGTLAGALGGATGGAGSVLVNGGSVEEAVAYAGISALSGAVGGAVGVWAGKSTDYIFGRTGTHLIDEAVSGAFGGVLGDAAGQVVMVSLDPKSKFSVAQLVFAGAVGGGFGAASGFERDFGNFIGGTIDEGLQNAVREIGGIAPRAPRDAYEPLYPSDVQSASVAGESGFWGVEPQQEALFDLIEKIRNRMKDPSYIPSKKDKKVVVVAARELMTGRVRASRSAGKKGVPNLEPELDEAVAHTQSLVEQEQIIDLGRGSFVTCAEPACANPLLTPVDVGGQTVTPRIRNLRFTEAYEITYMGPGMEPRIAIKAVCAYCSTTFGRAVFPDGARFQPTAPWGAGDSQ